MIKNYKRTLSSLAVLIIWTITLAHAQAQRLEAYSGPHTLQNGITGNAQYTYRNINDSSRVWQGAFQFSSGIESENPQNNYTLIQLRGFFSNGLMDGEWVIDISDVRLHIKGVSGFRPNAVFDGEQVILKGRFSSGKISGRWTMEKNAIRESRKTTTIATASLVFADGVATGPFSYSSKKERESEKITGQFDPSGNLHGEWKFEYEQKSGKVTELRHYSEGYLLALQRTAAGSDSLITSIAYHDVELKLRAADNLESDRTMMVRGDRPFGSLFNNGYRDNDERLTAQLTANAILDNVLFYWTDSSSPLFVKNGFNTPQAGFTRRFKFRYDQSEDSLKVLLRKELNMQYIITDSLRNSPVIKINRLNNDSIAHFYALLDYYSEKIGLLDTSLTRIESDQFDYEFRDNYFVSGIPETCGEETLKYDFENGIQRRKIQIEPCVDKPGGLLADMHTYLLALAAHRDAFYLAIKPRLDRFQNIAMLAEYDKIIVSLTDSVDIHYLGKIISKSTSSEMATLLEQGGELIRSVYERYAIEKRLKMIKEYAAESDPARKLETARSIEIMLIDLIEVESDLRKAQFIAPRLDSAYTRYSPNPFYPRDIESRIKPHIYSRGAEILLPSIERSIKRSQQTSEIKSALKTMFDLEIKMLELAERNDEEVNRLSSRLRKETQPERIKRLLGLTL